jgi:hypothetical protein
MLRQMVNDDDLFVSVVRTLTPAYRGPSVTLYRGQCKFEPPGMSWTPSFRMAEKFAVYGTYNVKLNQMHNNNFPKRTSGVIIREEFSPEEIISAPGLHGYSEGEFIVDVRGSFPEIIWPDPP